ncbi:MAG: sensor histidine kinase [Ornithinimicrobium sp.]|uniref:sensor histidine kinase n=1 Tax=Ornithinimicrobium sp. TaxID=1977084 RepID=UPI003D9BF2FF
MSPWSALALGLLLGVLLGGVSVVLLRRSAAAATPAPAPEVDELPTGVVEVLSALRSGGFVADASGRVLTDTRPSATGFGLVRNAQVTHHEVRHLLSRVLADGTIRETEIDLSRGPFGSGRLLIGVRVARVRRDLALVLIEDRTQARRVEEVRRDFVVNVSHELKTPVSGLSLLAEAVEDAADDPVAVRRFTRRMKVEALRLSRLVSEIVDLSRLQATDLQADLVVIDVAACAAEAVEQTKLIAGARRVSAQVASPRTDLRAYGDPELMTTSIRNLVANAIAYSEEGTRISVVTRRAHDVVEVAVTDQGQGIPVRDQERIFERFYRVDPARSRATGGTGLGLSIVKHVCVNHGGEITVWSQEGQGSTFTIRLPGLVDETAEVGAAAPPPHRRPTPLTEPGNATPLRDDRSRHRQTDTWQPDRAEAQSRADARAAGDSREVAR